MKQRSLILPTLAITLAGTAAWSAWQWWGRAGAKAVPAISATAQVSSKKTAPRIVPQTVVRNEQDKAPHEVSSSGAMQQNVPTATVPMPQTAATFQPAPALISEVELHRRAALVEQEANHDLRHLVPLLDLNETQQDRIFEALVRRAPDWHPAMQPVALTTPAPGVAANPNPVSGAGTSPAGSDPTLAATPAPTLLDDIANELTPEQQQELAEAELDRVEWWEAIIPQLLPDSETPALDTGSGTAAAAAPPPPEEIKEGGEEVILD